MTNFIFGNKSRITRLIDGDCLPQLSLQSIWNITSTDVIYTNRLRSPLIFLLKMVYGHQAPLIVGVSDGLLTPLLKRSNGKSFLEDLPIDKLVVMQPKTFELEKSIDLHNVLLDYDFYKLEEVDIDEVFLLFPNNPTVSLTKLEFLNETRLILKQASGVKVSILAQSKKAQNFAKVLKREFPHIDVYLNLDMNGYSKKNQVIITGPSSTYLYDKSAIPKALSFVRGEDMKYFYPLLPFQSLSNRSIWSVVSFTWQKLKVIDINTATKVQKNQVSFRSLMELDSAKAALGDILHLLRVLK